VAQEPCLHKRVETLEPCLVKRNRTEYFPFYMFLVG
jgi:hypothetical protein